MTTTTTWTERERAIWTPPRRITVSQWADLYRVVGRGSSKRGRWSTSFVEYTREIMDSINDPGVAEVTIIKSAQSSGTEVALNVLGYVIDQEPSPCVYVMPRDDDWAYIRADRVGPLIEETPALSRHITSTPTDLSKGTLRFDRCTVYFAGARSPAALASRPIRVVILDEVDKYPPWNAKEADPISLARARTTTFPDAKVLKLSTPTTRAGLIWREWEASDQREYHVACPACGHRQRLVWSQVRWPETQRDPDVIVAQRLARYRCEACPAEWTDAQRRAAIQTGQWVPGKPASSRRGYHVSGLMSPWTTLHGMAAKWLRAQNDAGRLQDFVNNELGEIWEERIDRPSPDSVAAGVRGYARGTVPDEALVVVAGADVQKREVYYEVRAFAAADESWLIEAGRFSSLDELEHLVDARWPRVGVGDTGLRLLCVDSGYRTDEVYSLAARYSDRVRAVKGMRDTTTRLPISRGTPIDRTVGGRAVGIAPWILDTSYFKDIVARQMAGERWHVHADPDPEWVAQVTSEQKVLDRGRRRGGVREIWAPVPGAGANHYWDAMVYSFAAAHMLGVHRLDTMATDDEGGGDGSGGEEPEPEQQQQPDRGGWLGAGRGWLDGARRGRWW